MTRYVLIFALCYSGAQGGSISSRVFWSEEKPHVEVVVDADLPEVDVPAELFDAQGTRLWAGPIKVKRRPVDRAVFSADFRARSYPGVALAWAAPVVGPEPWEVLIRAGHSKASVHLFAEHPKLDDFIDRLATEPNAGERVRIMRDEMGPWLYEYVPGIAIGAAHAIGGVGAKVGDWPLIPGHMGFHNWEYVTRK